VIIRTEFRDPTFPKKSRRVRSALVQPQVGTARISYLKENETERLPPNCEI